MKIDNLVAFKGYALNKKLQTTGAKAETSAGKPPASTVVKVEKTEATKPAITGAAGDVELPIIEPKALETVLEFVAKHLDNSSKVIPDPKSIREMESAYPTFSEAVGCKPEEMLNWPVSGLFGLAKTDPRAMVLFALEFRSLYRGTLKQTSVKETDKAVTTTTTTASGAKSQESIAKETHVAAKEVLAPKKSGFWTKKAA